MATTGREQGAAAIVRRLNAAVKSRRLYNSSHSLRADTLKGLFATIIAYQERFGSFALETHRSGLIVEGKPFEAEESISNLALLLYSVGVWQLVILPGITQPELAELLEIVTLAREAILAEGGFANLLAKRSVQHIRILELKPGDEDAVGLSAEVYRQLLDGSLPPHDRTALLGALRAGPDQAQGLLKAIVERTVQAFPLAAGQELGARIFSALAALDRLIVDTPSVESQTLMREFATAAAELDDPNRVTMHAAILARSAEDLSARALLSAMTSEQIARMVIPCLEAGDPTPQIAQVAPGLGFDPEKARETVALISQQLGGPTLEIPPLLEELTMPAWIRNIEQDLSDFSVGTTEMAVSKDTIQALVAQMRVDETALSREQVMTLVHLCTEDADPRELEAELDALVRRAVTLLEQDAFDLVDVVLRTLKHLTSDAGERADLGRAALRKFLGAVPNAITARELDQPSEHPLVVSLREVEAPAVAALAQALVAEKDPSRRAVIVVLLTQLGANHVDALDRYLREPRPEIARPIITILGQIRTPQAIARLGALAQHPDAALRMETIDLLGTIPMPAAQEVIRQFLKDPQAHIRVHALTYLRPETGRQVSSELLEMLFSRELSRHLPLRIQIVATLARSRAVDALPSLQRLASPFKIRQGDRALARYVRAAVAYLKAPLPDRSSVDGGRSA